MKKSVRSSNHVLRVCLSFTFLMLFTLSASQLQAQQNPYPFSLDLSFGGGLIGHPDINTSFQPEVGFSYMPGKFGIGLNAGLLSYDPAFDTQQYTAGFEEYTSVSGSNEKWSSFFMSLGPRFEFGSSLPVTFRSSLDLSLTYNSPPSMSVDFNDPDGSAGDLQLQLSGYDAGDDYRKWSAAIRPEFQMQFNPGGSDRFAITVATGIQHRLSQNEFTYSQRDLSEVRVVPNSQEMFMQFEMAPEIQQTAQPPKTNFFTTVGLKIKFGNSKRISALGQDYNATRSNKPGSIADGVGDSDADTDADGLDDGTEMVNDGSGAGDCDDSDSDRCIRPGERSSNDVDSDADGIDDAIETAKDHRSTKALKKGDRLSTEISDGVGDGDADSDGDGIDDAIETGQDYNASRSNKPRSEIADDIWDDCDDDGSCPHPDELLHKAKELELTSAGNDIQNIKEVLDRCGEEVCGQVRLHADKRHEGVRRALENPSTIDSEIEEIRNIVRKDVDSLGKCETDVCREVLAMEQQLLVKMNRLSDIAMVAPTQDYNATRSNKPTSRADGIGDGDPDSDGDGIDDAVETAQDYNATRSNKPTSRADLDGDPDSDDDGVAKAISMARLIHPPNVIIAAGSVAMEGNPLYKGNNTKGENPLYEGQANDGDSDNNDNEDPLPSQRYDMQPSSYCVEIGSNALQGKSTETQDYNSVRSNKPGSIADDIGDGDADSDADGIDDGIETAQDYNASRSNKPRSEIADDIGDGDPDSDDDGIDDANEMAQDYNSSRSNKPNTIADIGDVDGDGFPDMLENASFSIKHRKRPGRAKYGDITLKKSMNNDGDMDEDGFGKVDGLQFDLEIDPDDDGDGLGDVIESASYSISKRSARTGRSNQDSPQQEMTSPNNVYKWTYKLNALSAGEDLPGNGTLNVVFSDGSWHFDLQVDPVDLDDDDDALPELLQNSSFSISKRSARTGRNPQ